MLYSQINALHIHHVKVAALQNFIYRRFQREMFIHRHGARIQHAQINITFPRRRSIRLRAKQPHTHHERIFGKQPFERGQFSFQPQSHIEFHSVR